jgi:Na+-transporting methylmalonyl-CoA/oxaloacetate decarboxylase gamma subunit
MLTLLANATEATQTKFEIVAEGIVGLGVVLVSLATLTGIIAALSLFFKEKPAPAAAKPAAASGGTPAVAVAASAVASTGISDAHLKVVIAAAVHAVLGGSRGILTLVPGDTAWAGEGRRAVFQSHKLQ